MVFYRKYRPQTINELDSKVVRERLYSTLTFDDVAHAFLFTGPKGLGKTSSARIIAKAVNCEEKSKINPTPCSGQKSKLQLKTQNLENEKTNDQRPMTKDQIEPCNKCSQCVSITNGTNIDVLEIDGASNRGIDEVRDLREKVRLAPAASSKKVYIIDEVHMLTTEAFNALLKTLEEPPNHVIFVLCTTEPHKVPPTISSRCFHIPFKKATTDELVRSFERIIRKEKLKVDKEALDFIASLSDGSFRDGAKILEELTLVSKGKKITVEFIEATYQRSNIKDQISKMIEFLPERDTRKGLQLTSELVEQGVDFKYFIEQLILELHEMLLVQVGVEDNSKFKVSSEAGSLRQSSKLNTGEIKELVELLSRAYGELKYAVLPQLPLELAVVEWCVRKTQNTQYARKSESQKIRASDSPKVRHSDLPSLPSVPKISRSPNHSALDKFWQELISKVKVYNHSVAGLLRGCRLKSYDNKKIVIETGYKFHKEKLEEKKTMEILKRVCKEISGEAVSVSVLLKKQ